MSGEQPRWRKVPAGYWVNEINKKHEDNEIYSIPVSLEQQIRREAKEEVFKALRELPSVGHYKVPNSLNLQDDNLILADDIRKLIQELEENK